MEEYEVQELEGRKRSCNEWGNRLSHQPHSNEFDSYEGHKKHEAAIAIGELEFRLCHLPEQISKAVPR